MDLNDSATDATAALPNGVGCFVYACCFALPMCFANPASTFVTLSFPTDSFISLITPIDGHAGLEVGANDRNPDG